MSPIVALAVVAVSWAPAQTRPQPVPVGATAPAISADVWLPSAPDRAGKVVLLDFWATWCAPCVAQFPTMREWKKRFGDDLVIVGMTNLEGQTLQDVKRYAAKAKLPWPVAVDTAGATHKAFGVRPIPHTFLIDRKGIVRATHVGGRGFVELLPELEKVIAER